MNHIFRGESILEFIKSFPDDESCRAVIANEKWKDGFECSHCNHQKYVSLNKHHSRECTKCKYVKFHKVVDGF